jgi:hypothetical protein
VPKERLELSLPCGKRILRANSENPGSADSQEIAESEHVGERETHAGPPVAHPLGQPEAPAVDPVEAGLIAIMARASEAGEWAVVSELARQLDERRKVRGGVVSLDAERAKRGGKG